MVSVIIPTYNRKATLKRAMDSVLKQTYKDLELIVVDDGSTDETEGLVKSYTDPRVKYIRHKKNLGACAARNTGIKAAGGEYIAFQDSDDEWHLDKLEKQMEILECMGVDIVTCRLYTDDEYTKNRVQSMPYGLLVDKRDFAGIPTVTLLAHREVFEKVLFNTKLLSYQDAEFGMRAVRYYKLYAMKDVLVHSYVSKDSISLSASRLYHSCELMIKEYPNLEIEYPVLSLVLAKDLFKKSFWLKETDNITAQDIWKIALLVNSSWGMKMRYALAKLGLLRIIWFFISGARKILGSLGMGKYAHIVVDYMKFGQARGYIS